MVTPGRGARTPAPSPTLVRDRTPVNFTPQRYIAPDGTPQYVIWAEQWLVGGALQAPAAYLTEPATTTQEHDFHEDSLGRIWLAIGELALNGTEPTIPAVSALMERWGELDRVGGEARLTALSGSPWAFLYAGKAALAAHAEIVHTWGEKRAALAELSRQAHLTYNEPRVIDAAARFLTGRAGEMPAF